ncbi:MAG: hypothetical protein ACE5LV_10840, partial [Candidatus Aminicenantales bacterium]
KVFIAPNPPYGALISYYLKEEIKTSPLITITNAEGQKVKEIKGKKSRGLNRIAWDLRYGAPEVPGAGQRFRARGPLVLPGEYTVTLEVGEQKLARTVRVHEDPRIDISFEERKAQHDALVRLHNLYPYITAATRTIEDLNKELDEVKKLLRKVPDVPEEITKQADAMAETLKDIRIQLMGDPELGFRGMRASVRGRLFMLGRAIGGYTEAPSARRLQQVEENTKKLGELIRRVNRVIEEDIPKLNRMMNESNIPHVLPGKTIKFEIRT